MHPAAAITAVQLKFLLNITFIVFVIIFWLFLSDIRN